MKTNKILSNYFELAVLINGKKSVRYIIQENVSYKNKETSQQGICAYDVFSSGLGIVWDTKDV